MHRAPALTAPALFTFLNADPYRCDCGAELDSPTADCDRCGPRGPDHDDAAADRAIDAMAAASEADALVAQLGGAWPSFQALLEAAGDYEPTLAPNSGDLERDQAALRLADLYDQAQAARGDARRAYRGEAARTGARTLWTFTSSDGEGEQQHLVACATCSRSFEPTVPGKRTAQVADDDLACDVCARAARPRKGVAAVGLADRHSTLISVGDGTGDVLSTTTCRRCGDDVNPPISRHDEVLLADLFSADEVARLDRLTVRYTASRSFLHLVVDPGGVRRYRPSLYCATSYKGNEARELRPLADAYDALQAARQDSRRVYRG